ncbi:hypothetical protein GFL82_30560 [Rhizobium laguerreae]|nr:hypothetical protein [Rhizobium laguerreae]NKM72247.1 hypothetical protein [Rhizobium laguerreae]
MLVTGIRCAQVLARRRLPIIIATAVFTVLRHRDYAHLAPLRVFVTLIAVAAIWSWARSAAFTDSRGRSNIMWLLAPPDCSGSHLRASLNLPLVSETPPPSSQALSLRSMLAAD